MLPCCSRNAGSPGDSARGSGDVAGVAEDRGLEPGLAHFEGEVGVALVERRAVAHDAVVHQVEPGEQRGRAPARTAWRWCSGGGTPRRRRRAGRGWACRRSGCPNALSVSPRHWSARNSSTRSPAIIGHVGASPWPSRSRRSFSRDAARRQCRGGAAAHAFTRSVRGTEKTVHRIPIDAGARRLTLRLRPP